MVDIIFFRVTEIIGTDIIVALFALTFIFMVIAVFYLLTTV